MFFPNTSIGALFSGVSHGKLTVLIIAFASAALREACQDAAVAEAKYGQRVASALKRRLADLRAATSLSDLVAGAPTAVGEGARMVVRLLDGFQMVLAPNHQKNPQDGENRIEWSKVRRIKILEITNASVS
jgi:hypothetical protein